MGPKGQTLIGVSMVASSCCPSHGREHPWVSRAEHRVEHQWIHAAVLPMEEGAPMGPKEQTLVGAPMVAPCWCPSHGRGCTHGSQGLSTGWSTYGSMLLSIPMEEGAPMGPCLCPSNGRGCTHGSQGANIGWSINGGSVLVSILWKREHPWVHSGVLPMEKGAPMGSKWQTFVGAPMVAPSCCPSHGREHPWVHSGVLPIEEGAPMGPKS